MKSFLFGKSALCLVVALALVICVPMGHAKPGTKADKQALKIQKKLSKYKSGTLLHLEFTNSTECTGTLSTLSDTSFSFNNSETNAKETHQYSEVSSVEKGTEYIGAGSAPKHHIHIF